MLHTILSVDGDNSRRDATSQALRLAGFEVVEAVSAAEALNLASQLQPSLILLGAPPAGGEGPAEFCRRLKADPRTAASRRCTYTAKASPGATAAKGRKAAPTPACARPLCRKPWPPWPPR